jgi:hypothetical protein
MKNVILLLLLLTCFIGCSDQDSNFDDLEKEEQLPVDDLNDSQPF